MKKFIFISIFILFSLTESFAEQFDLFALPSLTPTSSENSFYTLSQLPILSSSINQIADISYSKPKTEIKEERTNLEKAADFALFTLNFFGYISQTPEERLLSVADKYKNPTQTDFLHAPNPYEINNPLGPEWQ